MAVEEIRSDMRELNRLVIEKFSEAELESEGLPPSEWAIGTDQNSKETLLISKGEKRLQFPLPSEMLLIPMIRGSLEYCLVMI